MTALATSHKNEVRCLKNEMEHIHRREEETKVLIMQEITTKLQEELQQALQGRRDTEIKASHELNLLRRVSLR